MPFNILKAALKSNQAAFNERDGVVRVASDPAKIESRGMDQSENPHF
jgi:hypothetical protein